jgi:hypothetical protein
VVVVGIPMLVETTFVALRMIEVSVVITEDFIA